MKDKRKDSITLREYLKVFNLHKSLEEEKNVLYSSFAKSQSKQKQVLQNIQLRRELKQAVKDKEKYDNIEDNIDKLNEQLNFKKRQKQRIQKKVNESCPFQQESSGLKKMKKRKTEAFTSMDQYYMAGYNRIVGQNQAVFDKQAKKENTEILQKKDNAKKDFRLSRAQSSLTSIKVYENGKNWESTPNNKEGNVVEKDEKQKFHKKKPVQRQYSAISLL